MVIAGASGHRSGRATYRNAQEGAEHLMVSFVASEEDGDRSSRAHGGGRLRPATNQVLRWGIGRAEATGRLY